jgi:hypothetical protein
MAACCLFCVAPKSRGKAPLRVKPEKAQSEYIFSGLPPAADIRQRGWHVGSVPILLQKDFAHLGEQHSLKVGRACATLIQKSIRPDSIVARFYCP